jgi:hypothetical protein
MMELPNGFTLVDLTTKMQVGMHGHKPTLLVVDYLGDAMAQIAVKSSSGKFYLRYMRQGGGRFSIQNSPLFDTLEEAVAYVLMVAEMP